MLQHLARSDFVLLLFVCDKISLCGEILASFKLFIPLLQASIMLGFWDARPCSTVKAYLKETEWLGCN